MKVLWVSSRLIGPAASVVTSDYHGTSGGWIQSEYDSFSIENNEIIHLCGSRERFAKKYKKVENDKGLVYLVELPKLTNGRRAPKSLVDTISKIIYDVKPDIIHLWGTETCIQDAVISANNKIPTVVFIQGLIGVHYRYRGGYITVLDKDYYSFSSIKQKCLKYFRDLAFKKQIEIEKNIIKKSKNIIIDSDFARAYCYSIDKSVKCFNRHLNPNLLFLKNKWDFSSCEKNTIFTVYGGSPDKGIHQLLKAIKIVKDEIPNIKVYIPGPFNINESGNLISTKKSSTYEKWMKNFIKTNKIENNVCFVGPQSPQNMADYIKKCNVYVNPSCMEVHALSLREAMTIGAPVISSLCGSVAEFINYNEEGFIYRYEEYEALALLIKKVLKDSELANRLGMNARKRMEKYYIESENQTLLNIYNKILGEEHENTIKIY
jgi:glycosyltransferase involved in cell wall biosynthesis